MIYSKKANIGFLHIKKTGGRSIKEVLRDNYDDFELCWKNYEHESLSAGLDALKNNYKIDPNKIRLLTSIRNPYDHVISLYYFYRQKSVNDNNINAIKIAKKSSNDDFLCYWCNSNDTNDRTYEDLLTINNKIPFNLFIIKLESIENDLSIFLDKTIKVPIIGKVEHPLKKDLYNKKSVFEIYKKYSWCFENGYYDFESWKE